MTEWNLPSSSGRDRITGVFLSTWRDAHNMNWVVADITFSGDFLERQKEPIGAAFVNDYALHLNQVILRRDKLDILVTELKEWFRTGNEFDVSLGEYYGQSFQISIGKTPELISSVDKPACTVSYSGGSLRFAEWSFIVDQSCLGIFLNELIVAISSL
jgi:hypothetical protein